MSKLLYWCIIDIQMNKNPVDIYLQGIKHNTKGYSTNKWSLSSGITFRGLLLFYVSLYGF